MLVANKTTFTWQCTHHEQRERPEEKAQTTSEESQTLGEQSQANSGEDDVALVLRAGRPTATNVALRPYSSKRHL